MWHKFSTIMVQAEAQVPQLLHRCFASEFQQDGGMWDPDCGSSATGNTFHIVYTVCATWYRVWGQTTYTYVQISVSRGDVSQGMTVFVIWITYFRVNRLVCKLCFLTTNYIIYCGKNCFATWTVDLWMGIWTVSCLYIKGLLWFWSWT
jgi:hypothetical protein